MLRPSSYKWKVIGSNLAGTWQTCTGSLILHPVEDQGVVIGIDVNRCSFACFSYKRLLLSPEDRVP